MNLSLFFLLFLCGAGVKTVNIHKQRLLQSLEKKALGRFSFTHVERQLIISWTATAIVC